MSRTTLKHRKMHSLISALVLLGLAALTFWLARTVRTAEVPSSSMEPTLKPGDLLLVRVDAYRHAQPRCGDVVVFTDAKRGGLLVKRVIGAPGDEVLVRSGWVWLNGQPLSEPYAQGGRIFEFPIYARLGQDEIFVMGDNRDHTEDSRDFGPVKLSRLLGKVTAIIWPRERRGRLPEVG